MHKKVGGQKVLLDSTLGKVGGQLPP